MSYLDELSKEKLTDYINKAVKSKHRYRDAAKNSKDESDYYWKKHDENGRRSGLEYDISAMMSKRNADYYDQKANDRQKFIVKAAKKRLTAKNRPKEFFRDAKQEDLFKEDVDDAILLYSLRQLGEKCDLDTEDLTVELRSAT